MFSEIMSAFTEVAEIKTKHSVKRALFSIKSLAVHYQSSRKWRTGKTPRKKLLPLMRTVHVFQNFSENSKE